jgi:hypothetical protein
MSYRCCRASVVDRWFHLTLARTVRMADDTVAFVIPLHQVPGERKDITGAMRAQAYRQRNRQKAELATSAAPPSSESLVPARARTESLASRQIEAARKRLMQ